MECLATYISRKKRKGFKCNTVLGCSYALSAALCGAAASLCIKLVQTADAGEILMMRWFVQYIVLLPLVTHRRQVTVGRNRSLNAALAIRVVAGTAASTLLYLNFTLLPVGDATAIMLTYIVMVGLLSLTVLKEPYGWIDGFLTILVLTGLVFIAQPSFIFPQSLEETKTDHRPLGIALGTLSAFLKAVVVVCIRKMGADVHFSLSLFYFSVFGFVVSAVYALAENNEGLPCSRDLMIMILVSVFALLSIIFETMALQVQEASLMTIVMTTQVVFAFLLEFLFLGEHPSVYSIVGASVISFSCLCLLVLNFRRKRARKVFVHELEEAQVLRENNNTK